MVVGETEKKKSKTKYCLKFYLRQLHDIIGNATYYSWVK